MQRGNHTCLVAAKKDSSSHRAAKSSLMCVFELTKMWSTSGPNILNGEPPDCEETVSKMCMM